MGERFFANLREQFFRVKTERLKEGRAMAQYTQTLLVKSVVALRMRAQCRQLKAYKTDLAD